MRNSENLYIDEQIVPVFVGVSNKVVIKSDPHSVGFNAL